MKAFPTTADNGHSENQDGMELRDYFAAHIIQGLLANNTTCDNDETVIESAWGLADKMIKARNDS
jgi:hypothetical protein